jgi:hypothetical protein
MFLYVSLIDFANSLNGFISLSVFTATSGVPNLPPRLKTKPEQVKKQILAGAMIVSMSFVVLVWFFSLGGRFGTPEVAVKTESDIKPFKLFAKSMSDTYKNIGASLGSISFSKKDSKENQKQIDLIPVEPKQ